MIGYVLNPPPWFYPLAFIAGLMLIWWNFRKNAAPNAVKSAQSLKDTQVLFNSAITPAHEAILAVINAMLQALQSSPDQNIRNLARAAHQGATDLAQTTYGNLARAVRGADSDEKQLQRLVGWFWNEYRLQTSFIKDNITAVRETSSNILNAPIFEQWLESDQRLRDALRSYCGPQNRDTIRSSMASNGWNDEVIRQIRSLRSSVMAIAAKKCAESRIMTNKPTKSLKLRPSRMEMVRIPLLSALAHDQCSSS